MKNGSKQPNWHQSAMKMVDRKKEQEGKQNKEQWQEPVGDYSRQYSAMDSKRF